MTRSEIIAEARRWIGTPYRPRGRSIRGLDCLGLLVMIGQHFGVPHTDRTDYSLWPRHDYLILRTLGEALRPQPMAPDTCLDGCVGVFAERRLPGHVGVFSRQHSAAHLIHARITPGRVVEQAWINHEEMRLIGLFAFPGMTD